MVAIMGHAGSRGTLVEIVDRAWCEVCEADPTAAKLAKKTNDAGKTSGEIPVPFELFGKMLTTEASADLFDTATTYGLRDQSPWTYMIEERYYHPVLLTIAKTRRRDSRNNKKVIEFKLGRAVRHKQHTVGTWHMIVGRYSCLLLTGFEHSVMSMIAPICDSRSSSLRRLAISPLACDDTLRDRTWNAVIGVADLDGGTRFAHRLNI